MGNLSIDLRNVLFFNSTGRMHHLVGKVAIIGDDNQPRRIFIQTPHGKETCPFGSINQINSSTLNPWIIGALIANRFVQSVVKSTDAMYYRLPVNCDCINLWINQRLRYDNLHSIDRNAAIEDKGFSSAA